MATGTCWGMRRHWYGVFVAVGFLLTRLETGEAIDTVVTEPSPGSTVEGVVGTANVSFYCDITNENGDSFVTNWNFMRAADVNLRSISATDNLENFILSGGVLVAGRFPQHSNLTIISLTEDLDNAIIFCGTDSDLTIVNFTIRIYFPPALMDQGEVAVRENEELSLDMREPESPLAFPFPSEVVWTRDGNEVMTSSENRVFNYSSIFIGSVETSDAGHYTLTASNYLPDDGATPFGTDTASFTLNVLFGAGLTDGPGRVGVLEGEPVTLVCGTDLTGNPIPNITWTDNTGSEVASGGRYTFSSGTAEVSLTLDSTVREDSGNWTCSAQVYENGTAVGEAVNRTLQLVVVVAPPAPEELEVIGVGPTWVAFEWFQLIGEDSVISHIITVENLGSGEMRNVTDESSRPSANVTDLLPGTWYNITVRSLSVLEGVEVVSAPSDPITANTTITVPAPVCSQSPAVENDRLVVMWSFTHTGGLPITSADVLFKADISSDPPQAFSSVSMVKLSELAVVNREDSIPLPEAGLQYEFTVIAGNTEGEGETQCPILRLDTGIPARPGPPEVSDGDPVIVTVTTEHSGVADSAQDQFRFILKITNVDDSSQESMEVPSSCGSGVCSESVVLRGGEGGLEEGETYIVSAMAVNRYGESQESDNSDQFTLPEEGTTTSSSSENPDGDSEENTASSTGAIVGAVIGVLAIVVILIVIAVLLFFIFKMRRKTEAYKVSGPGVRVEEVGNEIDLGKELGSEAQKELHYAELEHFQKPPDLLAATQQTNNNSLHHKIPDEPVQYATLQEIQPNKEPILNGTGEGGDKVDLSLGGGEADKALTSSTFV